MNHFVRRLLVVAGVTLAAVGLVIPGSRSAAPQSGLGDGTAPELEGTWRVELTPNGPLPPGLPPPPYRSLQTFTRGGVMMESNQFRESVGHGVWTRLGSRKFKFTFERLWLDPATATYIGKTVVTDEIELNGAVSEYTGSGSGVDYDPAGHVLNRYCGRTRGVRMRVPDLPSACR